MLLKRFSVYALACASLSTLISPSAGAQENLFSPQAKQKAEALLRQMTLDEKVGQLDQASGIILEGIATEEPDKLILQGSVVLWLNDVKEINRLQHFAIEKTRLHTFRSSSDST